MHTKFSHTNWKFLLKKKTMLLIKHYKKINTNCKIVTDCKKIKHNHQVNQQNKISAMIRF